MRPIIPAVLLATLCLCIAPPAALAHARLTKSAPAAGSKVGHVRRVVLTFSENLEASFSGAELVDGGEKPVAATVAIDGDAITLTTPDLKPGPYRVHWHSVGDDTHRMEGSFQFTVMP